MYILRAIRVYHTIFNNLNVGRTVHCYPGPAEAPNVCQWYWLCHLSGCSVCPSRRSWRTLTAVARFKCPRDPVTGMVTKPRSMTRTSFYPRIKADVLTHRRRSVHGCFYFHPILCYSLTKVIYMNVLGGRLGLRRR